MRVMTSKVVIDHAISTLSLTFCLILDIIDACNDFKSFN